MRFLCNKCGELFDESEADTRTINIELSCGVAGMFPDHHTRSVYICPFCYTSDIDPHEEEEEEEEEEDDEDDPKGNTCQP